MLNQNNQEQKKVYYINEWLELNVNQKNLKHAEDLILSGMQWSGINLKLNIFQPVQCKLLKYLQTQNEVTQLQITLNKSQFENLDAGVSSQFTKCIHSFKQLTYFSICFKNYLKLSPETITQMFICQQCQEDKDKISEKSHIFDANKIIGLSNKFKHFNDLKILKISLSNNKIGYDGVLCLATCIQNLNQLTHLFLTISEENKITPKGSQELAKGLQQLKELEELKLNVESKYYQFQFRINLFFTIIDVELFENTIECLEKLNNISITIQQKYVDREKWSSFFRVFRKLRELECLELIVSSNNQIGLITLAEILIGLQTLKELSMTIYEENQMVMDGGECFGVNLGELKQLEKFSFMAFENLNTECTLSLANGLKQLKSMKILSLMIQRGTSGNAAFELVSSIQKMNNLTQFTLELEQQSFVSLDVIKGFNQGVTNLQQIRQISLFFWMRNNINQKSLQLLTQGLSNLINLESLSLTIDHSNKIDQEGIYLIGKALKCLSKLSNLNLKINEQIQEEGANSIYEGIKSATNLKQLQLYFDMSENQYKGPLKILESVTTLKMLSFFQTNITQNTNKIMLFNNILSQIRRLSRLITIKFIK